MMTLNRASLGGALLALAIPGYSGTFTADFNSGTAPAGSTVQGTAGPGGTLPRTDLIEDGVLKITKNANDSYGSIVIDDLDAGAAVYGFELQAKVRIGGGTSTPADGFSVSFDPTIAAGAIPNEDGTANGITFSFDIFDNGGETPPAPSIDLKVGNALVATKKMTFQQMLTGDNYADLHILVEADGRTSVEFNGMTIFSDIYFSSYQPIVGGKFAIAGRTGGLNVNQWFDDLEITTFTEPHVGITRQPTSQTFVAGRDAVITLEARNTDGATFQWYEGETEIAGADTQNFTLPNVSVADSGRQFSVTIVGPNNTVTSDEVTITVVDIPVPTTPELSFDFNEGTGVVPEGTSLWGTGYVNTFGGVDNSGVLQLTDAFNDQRSNFIIENPDAGAPIHGFTATFDALLGGGSGRPADGFSFNLADDIIEDAAGELEEGIGNGLSIVFDIYDNLNGGGEAPALEVKFRRQLIASVKLPFSFFETGTDYAPVIIRLESDGTLDVAYKDVVVFDNLFIPGFTSISNGRFALAGRTGGQNINMWFDNIEITTDNTAGPLRVASQSASQIIASGSSATFSVAPNDETGVTYQWLKDGEEILGATESSYVIDSATVADDAGVYTVRLTKGGTSITSGPMALGVVDLSSPTVSFDFEDNATPAGTALYRSGEFADGVAGYILGGVLHLTDNVNGVAGAFVVDPLLGGAEVSAYRAAFDLRMGGGSGNSADAFHFNYAGDIGTGTAGIGGAGSGLTILFDIYNNGGEAPSINVEYKNSLVARTMFTKAQIETGDAFREVVVHVSDDGLLDLSYGGMIIHQGLQLPGYTPTVNGKFGFYALTGGENENFWVDNIRLHVTKSVAPLAITDEPDDLLILAGQTAAFNVLLNDPIGASYRWFRNDVEIGSATGTSYTSPALNVADDGTRFKVTATGPSGTVTSREAIVTVVPEISVSNPDVSYNFDDDLVPEGAFLNWPDPAPNEGIYTYISGGVVHLTDAINSQSGTLILPDLNPGESVNAMTASFSMLIGGNPGSPADGLSFVWGNDITDTSLFREGGAGNGLIVSFDTWVNLDAGETTPSIDVFYKGQLVARRAFPNTFIRTGDVFADVVVRVEADGTLDLQYRDTPIYSNLQLPGFEPVIGGRFGFGAGTGGANDNHWIDNIQIVTSVGEAAPEITNITESAGEITITWTGGGTLEWTDDVVNGDWTPLVGSESPYTTSNTGDMRFFRVAR